MKHPALARVFAVVLAIMGLLLLFSGVRGFGKTRDEHADRLAFEKKYAGRIENFEALRDELGQSADYDETMQALDRFLTEHEKAAAKHKTDTAIFSATKGGLKMGEDMIAAGRAQMNEIRDQLNNAGSRRVFLEGLLSELIASQKSKLPWLQTLANQAAQYATESYIEGAKVTLVATELRSLMDHEPTPELVKAVPYTPPEPPVELYLPVLPDVWDMGMGADALQSMYETAASEYMNSAAAYQRAAQDYVNEMQAYYEAGAQATMEQLNGRTAAEVLNDAELSAEYKLAHSLWEEECQAVKKQLDLHAARSAIPRLSSALSTLVRQGNSASASITAETGGIYPALAELTIMADATGARIDARITAEPSRLSNAEFLELTDAVEEFFELVTDAFIAVAKNLDNPAPMIAELLERLHITEILVQMLNERLEKVDHQMQAALEELWYQLGETEKDVLKLEAEKLGLDKEAVLLTKRTLDADALRDLRNRHASARQLLLNIPEVKARTRDDSELADNARLWLDSYQAETQRLHRGRLLVNALAVFGGVMGVLGIPAAYELIRRRFMLIAPVLLCLLCALGAEGLNMALGLGQQYWALFTAIFALLQLLIVLPKAKKPHYTPRHLHT